MWSGTLSGFCGTSQMSFCRQLASSLYITEALRNNWHFRFNLNRKVEGAFYCGWQHVVQLQLLIDAPIRCDDAQQVLGVAQGHSSVLTGARFGVSGRLFLTFGWQDKSTNRRL